MTGYMLFDESSDYYKYNGTVQLSKQKFILLDLGVLTYKSGKVFVGQINQPDSLGYLNDDMHSYIGQFSDGKKHGFGVLSENNL